MSDQPHERCPFCGVDAFSLFSHGFSRCRAMGISGAGLVYTESHECAACKTQVARFVSGSFSVVLSQVATAAGVERRKLWDLVDKLDAKGSIEWHEQLTNRMLDDQVAEDAV